MFEQHSSANSAQVMPRMVPKDQFANAWTMLRFPFMSPPKLCRAGFFES
jgi:hypothetical protein